MLISDDRITHLSCEIAQTLIREGFVATKTPESCTQEIRRALTKYCQAEVTLEQKVQAKIGSLKRAVPEGSREWDILYQKYYEEELNKSV